MVKKIQLFLLPISEHFKKVELSKRSFYIRVGLGIVYLIAFSSLMVQLNGLFLNNGISSINSLIGFNNLSLKHFFYIPTLFLISASDMVIVLLCLLGMLASIFLILGVLPFYSAFILWMSYLSFLNVGYPFLSFQWDILLIEAGFICLFLFPVKSIYIKEKTIQSPVWVIYAFRILLFKLMFASGLVKILSGDAAWLNLTALNYHYYTQPLPHVLSWFAHQLPAWIDKICVLLMLFIELVIPFGLFFGSRLRHYCGIIFSVFMIVIMLTGNYTFFNLLVIVLCISCFNFKNDKQFVKNLDYGLFTKSFVLFFLILFSLFLESNRFVFKQSLKSSVFKINHAFKWVNQYGLFTIMTKERYEIEIWASLDGVHWKPYKFKSKVNNKTDMPKWVLPHQPRLDWQMWFVPLGSIQNQQWLFVLANKLRLKSPAVEKLFKEVPFKEKPNYLVFKKRKVTFSDPERLIKKGEWWVFDKDSNYSSVIKFK